MLGTGTEQGNQNQGQCWRSMEREYRRDQTRLWAVGMDKKGRFKGCLGENATGMSGCGGGVGEGDGGVNGVGQASFLAG